MTTRGQGYRKLSEERTGEKSGRKKDEAKDQKMRSRRRRLPKEPMLAIMKVEVKRFSVRTGPRLMRRYSRARPQQLPL